MSSAAVQQSTPQQYQQPTAGHDRAAYSNSPSTRRSNRSSTGHASVPNTPQQPQYSPNNASMSSPGMAPSTYQQFYPDAQGAAAPAMSLPIRTSQGTTNTPPAAYDTRPYSSRGYTSGGYGSEGERGSDSERRRQRHSRDGSTTAAQPSGGGSRSQRTRNAPQQSRSQTAVGQTPIDTSLPRENSAVINRIVVDDPQSDIARERARVAEATPTHQGHGLAGDAGMSDSQQQRNSTGQRSRQEHLKQTANRKEVKFGDYVLGQTLGEGEFGKVKMGWKKDGGVQVAIKLIRKESLAGNTTRLPKIYREISILRELQHPNIVRLHEFVETERHMGIILEYASGGELFDYILNHRYLKDPAARRLFAQLVSGVGYLHKKGIVHRDLKLENLLLDRNRNIIITDFGFANTFNSNDELGDEVERRIADKDYVKREGLDVIGKDGHRRADLMQTSCGSPCYAAPELVVSDGLYTGRKVDVWSCGVILYAMLAGYLPFDDDPANPEGDNINLLYKYIVSTPLTFPEYVTPHARDLLRRILVPEPRRRADLFEVARHSWLGDYGHVVGHIGSNVKNENESTASINQREDEPALGRSASVREPTSRSPPLASPAAQKQAMLAAAAEEKARQEQRDAKRKTVQVEYVAPAEDAARTQVSNPQPVQQTAVLSTGTGKTRARAESAGPVEVAPTAAPRTPQQISRKEVPTQPMPPPAARPARDQARAASDNPAYGASTTASRPNTGGGFGGARLPSRGNSYSQPAIATPTTENAQGRFSQPKPNSGYIISGPMPPAQGAETRPASQQNLSSFQPEVPQAAQRGHKRSTTLGNITDRVLGRSNSRKSQHAPTTPQTEKKDRKYPPISMRNARPVENAEPQPRPSTDSRRTSFGFSRKNSDAPSNSERRNSKRFSFLPSSFSQISFTGRKDPNDERPGSRRGSFGLRRPESKGMAFGRGTSPSPSQGTSHSTIPLGYDQDPSRQQQSQQQRVPRRYDATPDKALPQASQPGNSPYVSRKQYRDDGYGSNLLEEARQDPPERFYTPGTDPTQYDAAYDQADDYDESPAGAGGVMRANSGAIRPNQRRFADAAYDQGHGGSSTGARRVMDFFRRKGKDRSQQ
ncbi:Pkinase-domain-containing protein [Polychaeton citri CBS 116435]|uniref:non-specific serine/threonine protein kinase n=1 Tax=Polychaeton citri CBS 116435 TaxID=1314669 RepID=A0A9P4Q8P4_9PEZI|nr:Pkinase-domain-containing protein [Polychaeton citri CBS 116435]